MPSFTVEHDNYLFLSSKLYMYSIVNPQCHMYTGLPGYASPGGTFALDDYSALKHKPQHSFSNRVSEFVH